MTAAPIAWALGFLADMLLAVGEAFRTVAEKARDLWVWGWRR
jgi:hypothetical protein